MTHLTRARGPAAALALLLAPLSGAAAAQVPEGDLAQLMPTSTVLFIQLDALEKVALLDPDGAMMTLVRHPAVKVAFEEAYEFFDGMDDDELLLDLGLDKDELGRLFNGRIMLAVPEVVLEETDVKVGATTQVSLSLEASRGGVIMADFGGTEERLEELLEAYVTMREDEPEVHKAALLAEDRDGVTLFNIAEVGTDFEVDDEDWFALVDELLIYADKEETLLDFLDLADRGAPEGDRLADDPRYFDALDRVGDRDALVYVNLGVLLPLVNDLIASELKQQGMSVAMFLRPEDLIAAMRLDALESLFFGMRVDDDEAELTFGFTHAETDYGLHTLLSYADTGVEIPDYFSSDFHSASISTFDVATAYEHFDQMLRKASPTAHGMLDGQIEQLETGAFPLREALLDNMDGRFVEILGYPEKTLAGPEDHPTQAYVLKVRDPQSLEQALARLVEESVPDSRPQEFMNETLHTLPLPPMFAPGVSDARLTVAVVGNELIACMGQTKMAENIIAHLKNPGASLLDDVDLMDAFDALPSDDVVGLGFVNVADNIANVIRAGDGALSAQLLSASEGDDLEALLEMQERIDEIPDVSDLHYYVVSKTYKSPDAFVQRMLLRPDLDP